MPMNYVIFQTHVSTRIYLNSSCDLIAIAVSTLYQFTTGGKYMK